MRSPEGTAKGRELIVSVHDVAPSTLRETRWLLAALDGISARPRTLMVIPAEPDRPPDEELELYAALLAVAADGTELVLHGFNHRRSGAFRGPWPDRLRGQLFARGQAEFLALDTPAMHDRLQRGRAVLAEAGLRVAGFCAPGWLAAPGLRPTLAGLGFRYLVGFASVTDLRRGMRIFAPSGGYMGVPPDEGLIRIETALARSLAGRRPLQIFFHPQGASHSRACARVLRLLEGELRRRRPTTYEALVDGPA